MHGLREGEIFEQIDADASGVMDADEVRGLVSLLGIKMNAKELQDAMFVMDDDGSGEVDFEEFFAWWTNPGTQQYVGKSRERMEKLKQVFDTLDDDASGEHL